MLLDKSTLSFVQDKYDEISRKVDKLQNLLGIIFLQELKIVSDYEGKIKDIILLLGDIEGFSHKSYKNMLLALNVYNKIFNFAGSENLKEILSTIFSGDFKRGVDQYIGVSLLSGKIVEYYGIIGGIRPTKDIISINFYPNYFENIKKVFPVVKEITDGTPGNFFIKFDSIGNIIDKRFYFYDTNPYKFLDKSKKSQSNIKNNEIRSYVDNFIKSASTGYWKEYICWSGYKYNDKTNKYNTMEFFLKSKVRKKILEKTDFYFNKDVFLEGYICELSYMDKEISTWFLVKDSYLKRKANGLYNHQIGYE